MDKDQRVHDLTILYMQLENADDQSIVTGSDSFCEFSRRYCKIYSELYQWIPDQPETPPSE